MTMADLRLVPPTDAEEQAVILLRNGYISLEDIGRQTGIGRQRLRSLQGIHDPKRRNKIRTGEKRAPAVIPRVLVPVSAPSSTFVQPACPDIVRPMGQTFWGIVATLIGAGLAIAGIGLNMQYWWTVGGNNIVVAMTFCMMGGLLDSATVAIPSWATGLWRNGNWFWSPVVALCFIPVAFISLIASAGFSGTYIGDTVQGRGDKMTSKTKLGAVIAQKEAERKAVAGTDTPEDLETHIQDERPRIPPSIRLSSKDCTDRSLPATASACFVIKELRNQKDKAEKRIKLDAELGSLWEKYEAMPSIASKDAASERTSQMTGGYIKPEMVLSYLIWAMSWAPILSGLLFPIGTALRRSETPADRPRR